MGNKLVDQFIKVTGTIGALITGVTAAFTAAGFLAERARLSVLGLPSSTFDLERYLDTGARLLTWLPVYLVMGALNWARSPSFWIVLSTGLLLLFLWWRFRRIKNTDSTFGIFILRLIYIKKYYANLHSIPTWVLIIFFLNQLIVVFMLLQPLQVRNLLFHDAPSSLVLDTQEEQPIQNCTLWLQDLDSDSQNTSFSEKLTRRIRCADQGALAQYLLLLFAAITISSIITLKLWRFHRNRSLRASILPPPWLLPFLWILIVQLTLFPYVFGILFPASNFSEVEICFANPKESQATVPIDNRLILLRENDLGFFLYSYCKKNIWYVPRSDLARIIYFDDVNALDPFVTITKCGHNGSLLLGKKLSSCSVNFDKSINATP